MYRLIVALLAALDALVAAAIGLAIVLVPLALLWLFGTQGAEWDALWTAGGGIFLLGHLVPVAVQLPIEYLAAAGIDPTGAAFTIGLAPLALAAVTALLAAKSGIRAVRGGAGITAVFAGTIVFAVAGFAVSISSATPILGTTPWQAALFPAAVYGVPALLAVAVTAWREGDDAVMDGLRLRLDDAPASAGDVIDAVGRAVATMLLGLASVGALVVVLALAVRGGAVIALSQTAGLDGWGAVMMALAQFAYLPTLVVWGLAFAAGPGVAIGAGTTVSPAATQLGVVPGVPILGVLPEATGPWLLVLVLLPIAIGAVAGLVGRRRLPDERVAGRLVVLAGTVLVGAGSAAVAALLASGGIGPGRLSEVGPEPGPLALAVGVELAVGAAVTLFAPLSRLGADRTPTAVGVATPPR